MTPTILVLLGGLVLALAGVGLLGTLLGVRAGMEAFGDLQTGLIMAGYYGGYVAGTLLAPRIIRNVGHIRSLAAFAALGAATSLAFGLIVDPWIWLALRLASGLCVLGLYMVVESWLNEQSAGPARARIFSIYMASTLVALGAGQFLLLAADSTGQTLFALTAIPICLGVVPIAVTRVRVRRSVTPRPCELPSCCVSLRSEWPERSLPESSPALSWAWPRSSDKAWRWKRRRSPCS